MPILSDDLHFATITELNQKLRAKAVSARELASGFGERLETIGPRLNALALSLTKPAEKAAKAVDGDLKRERYRGALQGIPYGAKDLLAVAKFPTTWGARPYAGQVFDFDATVIEKLAHTGALLVGKLAMVELAGGGGYDSAAASLFGPGLNPWDVTRWTGGSSSGSAAAVAAGLVPFALGSETWGSILSPAAYCGVTGLRPTYGLVSRHGAMALSWTMDKLGPLCRTAEDCGHVLAAIAGGDSQDPGSAGKGFYYTPQYARPLSDLKAGFAAVDFEQWAAPALRPVFEQALGVLRDCGLKMEPAKLPDFPYGAVASTIIGGEAASIFEDLIRSGQVEQLADPVQIAGLRSKLDLPAVTYLRAMRIRTLIKAGLRELFGDFDVLIAPAKLNIAPRITEHLEIRAADPAPVPSDPGLTNLSAAGNLAGLPALCLPCGFADGMPVGIQLVGSPFTENTLLAIGKAFQDRTDFHRRRPKLETAALS